MPLYGNIRCFEKLRSLFHVSSNWIIPQSIFFCLLSADQLFLHCKFQVKLGQGRVYQFGKAYSLRHL